MPTEQGMGSPKLASDVYAVGAIAVQCLTGSHPYSLFDNDILQLEWQHLCRVNRDFATVIDRMIVPDYRQRYANATEALGAIESLISPPARQQVKAQPQPAIPPATPILAINTPKFQIQFTSVRLNYGGAIVDRPIGSAEIFTEDLGNSVELTMVKIPAGKFMMGSPANENGRSDSESPQHQVNVSEFYLGQTLITQAQWQAIMGNNPSNFKGNARLPVEHVSCLNAMDFCQKLSQKTGRTYRLPSEAEWEYACRAGTTTPFAFGEAITPAVVNYGKYEQKTTPVSSFPPNLFGLYDMYGNLWEWCLDEWIENYNLVPPDGSARGNISSQNGDKKRLLRGGSWFNGKSLCRSANRLYFAASIRNSTIGFRVACVLSRTS